MCIGKTTTLEAIVMKIKLDGHSEPSICYAAFNKTTETEFGERIRKKLMEQSLPNRDIESRTLHSLCYNWFIGTRNNAFISNMKEDLETEAVVKFFQIDRYVAQRYGTSTITVHSGQGKGRNKQQRIRFEATWVAELILKTLDNFLNSASAEVVDKHLPYQITHKFKEWTDRLDHHVERTVTIPAAKHYERYDFKGYAMALYQQSVTHNEAAGLPVTHSVYQKFAQLSNAILLSKRSRSFDVFLVDEAQDLNECQCALVTRQWQNGATIALVGDPAQSIYQFRGACRQFERWEVDAEETLTQSFRFGSQVARVCNVFLGLEKLWLVGLKQAVEARGGTGSVVKKEFGKSEVASMKMEGGGIGIGTPVAATGAGAGETGTAGMTMIRALVRGLEGVRDDWVAPDTVLAYPHTIICRTNNNTYYALLAGIQEARRQERKARGHEKQDVFAFSNPLNTTSTTGAAPSIKNEKNPNLKRSFHDISEVESKGAVVFDLTVGDDNNGETPPPVYLKHSLARSATNGSAGCSTSTATTTTTAVTAAELTAKAAHRLFYINGVRSYAQLEKTLVHRIEKLSSISIQKPYFYKGEEYTSLDALKSLSLETDDVALLELVEITEKWGKDIDHIKKLIAEHYSPTAAEADVLVTTVHKSKGLEWDNVGLGDDIGSPLAVQPMYVVQCCCEGDQDGKSSGGDGCSVGFMVALEQTAKEAYQRVNHLLCVGGAPAPTATTGSSGKNSPSNAFTAKKNQRPDHVPAVWQCQRCKLCNTDKTSRCGRCGTCYQSPAHGLGGDQGGPAVFDAEEDQYNAGCYGDSGDDWDGLDATPARAKDALQKMGSSTDVEVSPALFAPSLHHKLVPLLPSTIALGMQIQRNGLAATPGGIGTPGLAAGSPRNTRCPLLCCVAAHKTCVARVQVMFHHEVAERRRMYGGANVCSIERCGDNAVSYRLAFPEGGQQSAAVGASLDNLIRERQSTSSTPTSTTTPCKETQNGASQYYLDPFLIKFPSRQNANEWYVAVSRAKQRLRVNADLALILEWIRRDIGGLRSQLRRVIGDEADPLTAGEAGVDS